MLFQWKYAFATFWQDLTANTKPIMFDSCLPVGQFELNFLVLSRTLIGAAVAPDACMESKRFQKAAIGAVLALGTLANLSAWAARAVETQRPYACVLNFERKTHIISAYLSQKLSDMEGVRLINEARPLDMLNCLDNGAEALMVVGHAADLDSERQVTAPLVYFRELKGEDRKNFLDKLQRALDKEVADFKEKVRTNRLKADEGGHYYKMFELNERVKQIPENRPIYDQPRLVENQIFRRILRNPENLKKISIVSCLPEETEAYYPEFKELRERGVEVEFGPLNRFMTFLMGKNVASPDIDWMRATLEASVSEAKAKNLPENPGSQDAEHAAQGKSITRGAH